MSENCKCLKCGKTFEAELPSVVEKLTKNGCSDCHSKNLEWKTRINVGDYNWINLCFITDECSKCHLIKVIDIPNWEEIKATAIKKGGFKNKKEFIKKMNDKMEGESCYCSSIGFNWKSPWVIGGGLVIVGLIIGLIVWLTTRKKKGKENEQKF